MSAEIKSAWPDSVMGGVMAVITAVVFYPFAALGVDPHHDGIMLKPALDVLAGQTLFRDTFSQYGPLTTYLQVLALAVEPTLMSLRLLTVAAYAGSIFFLYQAWRTLLPHFLCVVAAVWYVIYAPFYDPYWPMLPWSSALALLFQSVAMWTLARIVRGGSPAGWGWVLGAACAGTFWCRQPVGILLGGTVAVAALLLHATGWRPAGADVRKVVARVMLGFAVVSAPMLAHMAFQGALGDWWYQNFVWPRQWAGRIDETLFEAFRSRHLRWREGGLLVCLLAVCLAPAITRRFRPGLPAWADPAWVAALAGVYLMFEFKWARSCLLLPAGAGGGAWTVLIAAGMCLLPVWALVSKFHEDGEGRGGYHVVLSLGILSVGALAQLYPVPCMNHTFWAVAPALGVFIYLLWRWTGAGTTACGLVLLMMLAPAAHEKYVLSRHAMRIQAVELQSPPMLKGMRVEQSQADAYARLNGLITTLHNRDPGRVGLLYGNDALYLAFFANRTNPSPYYVEWPKLVPRAERERRLQYLLHEKPVLIFNEREKEMVTRFLAVVADVGYRVVRQETVLNVWIALPEEEAIRYGE